MAKPITFTLNFLEAVSRQQFYASTYDNNRLLCSGLKYILCKFGRVYIVHITDPLRMFNQLLYVHDIGCSHIDEVSPF